MDASKSEKIFNALATFRIELPSWGFANTGTRFGKFIQPAAATTTEEKLSDAGQLHLLTGVCPTVALHVLWDFPDGVRSTDNVKKSADHYGVLPGSINPNLFQDQEYKYGSFGNPNAAVRERALQHTKDSIEIARRLHSRDISMWFADGSNYPGTANIRQRKEWFKEVLKESHAALSSGQRLLIEDVEARARDAPLAQRRDQRAFVHDRAARRVHEERAGLNEREPARVDEVARGLGQRDVDRDDVARREQRIELAALGAGLLRDFVREVRAPREHLHPERKPQPRDVPAHAAETHEAQRLAVQHGRERRGPLAAPERGVAGRDLAHHGLGQPDRELCGSDRIAARRLRDHDAAVTRNRSAG